MKKVLVFGAALVAAATVTASALAADPVVPFPAAKVGGVFVAAQTVGTDGAMNNYFAPGGTVVFRAYAVDAKTRKALGAKDVTYFYVTIPNQPNVKLKYDPTAPGASTRLPWTGTWTVPASYPAGNVAFKVLVKAKAKRKGSFVQMPVATAMLTVTATPPAALGPAASSASSGLVATGKLDMSLYVDTVNGSRPVGVAPRQIGCAQTNVYRRGEQVVLRAWGTDLTTGDILSSDNIKEAHIEIPGQPNGTLNWGGHGATGAKVWFWTSPWIIPASYPLGDATIHVVFTTESGKTGSYDYTINVIP